MTVMNFADQIEFNPIEKTALSVRDGVLVYHGSEIGMDPPDKEFTVYRSPATIANAAQYITGIPVTIDHISLDGDAPTTGSTVSESSMVDMFDEDTRTTIAVKNKLCLDKNALSLMDEKRQLSLGYRANLVPSENDYDFEQQDIMPHHLAILHKGRCGALCSFIDKKGVKKMSLKTYWKEFKDKTPQPSLEQIAELAESVSKGISKMSIDKLMQVLPTLQQVAAFAEPAAEGDLQAEGEADIMPPAEGAEEPAMDAAPMEGEAAPMESEESVMDNAPKFSDAAVKAKIRDAVKNEVVKFAKTVKRASLFLPDTYDFSDGKTARQIMRDVIRRHKPNSNITDNNLELAFEMLDAPTRTYASFGDSSKKSKFTDLANKEAC